MIHQRNFYTEKIYKALNLLPIVVLIGARQVGKTTILQNLDLNGEKLFLNGQNPEINEIFQKYSTLEAYLKINMNSDLNGFLLIDEFQYIHGISTMLKLLADNCNNLKILCTGSSSLDILQKVEESLAGRVRIIEIFSLSFEEYLMFVDTKLFELFQKYDSKSDNLIVNKQIHVKLNEYLLYGGLPRITQTNLPEEKIELLDDIYRTYLLHDVRSYVRNEDSLGFNKLLKILTAQIGNLVNVNELSVTSGLSYKKCEEYISLLEQMYIIKLVEPFHTNKRKTITKMRKVYFTDLGLRNLIYNSFNEIDIRTDGGSIFENYVYLELLRKTGKKGIINFYRTNDGSEVDFIVNNLNQLYSIEVKHKEIKQPGYHKNLDSFNKLENVTNSFIVNKTLNLISTKHQYIQGYLVNKMSI